MNLKNMYINFNFSKDFLLLGLEDGYEIYKLVPFELKIKNELNKSVGIIDILNNTNILVFSGNKKNGYCNLNSFVLYDDNEKKDIGKISCESNILNLKITDKYVLVVLIDKVMIYNLNLKLLHFIETGINLEGIIGMNYNDNELKYSLLSKLKGNIIIGNDNIFSKREIKVHNNIVNNICYNSNGSILATSSKKGTIIRLFSVNNDYIKIKELRRGSTLTRIINMNFNIDSNIFLCSTINGTIHLFNTGLNNELNHLENKKLKYIPNIINNLPNNQLTKYFKSEWSFSKFQIDNIIFILTIFQDNFIYTISNDGKFYKLLLKENGNIEIVNIIFFAEKYISPFNHIKNNN